MSIRSIHWSPRLVPAVLRVHLAVDGDDLHATRAAEDGVADAAAALLVHPLHVLLVQPILRPRSLTVSAPFA
jgi:hypothetical protein